MQWLVPDHLGTPRIIVDETGNRANVKRHDYQPFGEELFTGTGGRTVALGYAGDGVRQQFTAYEHDAESGLDFAGARFYASTQGRFTSLDPLMASAVPANPQTFNRYSYVSNSPMTQIDPSGMFGISPGGSQLGGIGNLAFFTSDQGTSASTDEEAKRNMQTAKMTPVAPEELAVYRANIGEMLSVPTCRNFIRQLLDEAKMVTGKSYNDVLGTFDTVKFYWKNEPPWYGGHAMFEQGKPAATISDAVKTEKFINEGRTRFLISQTTHSFFAETLHHVGVNGAYGDGAMAQALNNILVKQGKDKAQTFDLRGINEKEINRASLYWHPKVENFCRAPRK